MTSQQIQTLLAPTNSSKADEDALLFLNSNFRTLGDLSQLDDALEKARLQKVDLNAKLEKSQIAVDHTLEETHALAETYRQAARELSLQRHALADEVASLAHGLVSAMSDEGNKQPTLLEDLETMHRSLKELQNVKSYVQIVEHALQLSEAASKQASPVPTAVTASCISQFRDLCNFVSRVCSVCSEVETADTQSINLVTFLERLRDNTWTNIKSVFAMTLLDAAEKIKWPSKVSYFTMPEADRKAFEVAFRATLELQIIGEPFNKKPRTEKDGLYPIEALVLPLAQRFQYHFEGARETNLISKPEWYFTHVINLIHEHKQFMDTVATPLLVGSKYQAVDAWHEFILLLLPLLTRKLRKTVPSLLFRPALLAYTIYQALAFDATLSELNFTITDTSLGLSGQKEEWQGVAQVVLGNPDWFDAWIEGEQRFGQEQFQDIISSADAWQIADDESGRDVDAQTTHSARRLVALVEQIADRYMPLPDFTHRTRFLISVQLPILDMYSHRISSSLDAFEQLSSALVRAVPGALGVSLSNRDEQKVNVDVQNLTSGLTGIQRLCKAFLSAKYVVAAIETWSEQLFFLELWTEINKRASLRSRAQACAFLPSPTGVESYASDDTVFDVVKAHYIQLSSRALDIMVQQVGAEVEASLKAHLTNAITQRDEYDDIKVPQTLLAPIGLLSTHLSYLRSILPLPSANALYRRIAARLADHIMQRQILYRGTISLGEAKEIRAECELWVETCNAALSGALGGGRGRVEAPWAKLLQASRVLALEGELWDRLVRATMRASDEWEDVVTEITGFNDLGREDVDRILRRRTHE
ncbi:hypothetical protein CYLTODRAFT_378693 [Cylindrobasidium torrendii FP15055 ss-10]|uniref:RINT-1 family protein n=1 Tax=Cylindrobasidium torrendii FP15055 ss-10 TaxID=1314674 RepID=A0A0D7B5X5_9AGAR|nr:hypothetical protein CYLTODRAFT_378693 [Cylindrobasidium torrendii FP15055 ss-10]